MRKLSEHSRMHCRNTENLRFCNFLGCCKMWRISQEIMQLALSKVNGMCKGGFEIFVEIFFISKYQKTFQGDLFSFSHILVIHRKVGKTFEKKFRDVPKITSIQWELSQKKEKPIYYLLLGHFLVKMPTKKWKSRLSLIFFFVKQQTHLEPLHFLWSCIFAFFSSSSAMSNVERTYALDTLLYIPKNFRNINLECFHDSPFAFLNRTHIKNISIIPRLSFTRISATFTGMLFGWIKWTTNSIIH